MYLPSPPDEWRSRRERRSRNRLADRLEALVAEAERPPRRRPGSISARVPLNGPGVLRARHELLDLAAILRSEAPVGRHGVGLVHHLVCDGTSPLFAHRYAGDVAAVAERAMAALGGRAA